MSRISLTSHHCVVLQIFFLEGCQRSSKVVNGLPKCSTFVSWKTKRRTEDHETAYQRPRNGVSWKAQRRRLFSRRSSHSWIWGHNQNVLEKQWVKLSIAKCTRHQVWNWPMPTGKSAQPTMPRPSVSKHSASATWPSTSARMVLLTRWMWWWECSKPTATAS